MRGFKLLLALLFLFLLFAQPVSGRRTTVSGFDFAACGLSEGGRT